jgi:ribose transport system permease protein
VNTFAGTHMASTGNAWLWVVVLLAFGWLPGAINAALITYGRVQPFIATLGTWFVWGGIAYCLLESPGGSVSADFGTAVVLSTFLGIDTPVWILIVLIVFSLWFIRTRVGVSIRAVGSNAEATALRGVSVRRSIFVAYCLSSFLAVAAGLVQSAQSLSGDPTIGDDFILLSVAAAVIGGTSLLGGRGSAIGAIVGVLILTYMQTLVIALGLRNEWSLIISGCLLIASVGIQRLSTHDER